MPKYRVMMNIVRSSSFEDTGFDKWKDYASLDEAIVVAISLLWCEAVETEIWEISGRGQGRKPGWRPKVISRNWAPCHSIDDPRPQSICFSVMAGALMQSAWVSSTEEAMKILGVERKAAASPGRSLPSSLLRLSHPTRRRVERTVSL